MVNGRGGDDASSGAVFGSCKAFCEVRERNTFPGMRSASTCLQSELTCLLLKLSDFEYLSEKLSKRLFDFVS